MFKSVEELVQLAEKNDKKIWEIMLEQEMKVSNLSQAALWDAMLRRYEIMADAIQEGIKGVESRSGLTGGDAKKLYDYIQAGQYLTDKTFLLASCYAMATNEVNAAMGVICATPTAGSSGTLPGVLFALQETKNFTKNQIIEALFTAGAFGYVIANNAVISGASGGCQAEVGSAAAMAAGAIVELAGGSPKQASHGMAIALKNLLGLACDPVGGLVEVPCVKRNSGGASIALAAAELALAGVESRIPADEVINAMYQIGINMPEAVRETAMGGLAQTETGKYWLERIASKDAFKPHTEG